MQILFLKKKLHEFLKSRCFLIISTTTKRPSTERTFQIRVFWWPYITIQFVASQIYDICDGIKLCSSVCLFVCIQDSSKNSQRSLGKDSDKVAYGIRNSGNRLCEWDIDEKWLNSLRNHSSKKNYSKIRLVEITKKLQL